MPSSNFTKRQIGGRFVTTVLIAGLAGSVVWMVRDYLYVRVPDWKTHADELAFLLFPVGAAATIVAWLPRSKLSQRIWLGVAAAVVTSLIVILFVLLVGMQFHLAIGGQL